MKPYCPQFFLAAVALAALSVSAAERRPASSDAPPEKLRKRGEITSDMIRKVDASMVEFTRIGATRLAAGTPGVIGVQLFNHGVKEVEIPEWYMVDEYNFSVFYRRLPSDRPGDSRTPWLHCVPKIPAKARRVPLVMKSRTRAQFQVPLPFIGELAPGEQAEFEVYVATALKTVQMRTPVFLITTE